jgi:DNA-binding SARP family transcriptional activator/tetratricopeptide (TPR) repeat protein
VQFRLLGPVEVWDGGHPLPLARGKPRTLLASLLLNPDRVVPADRLVDVIWGDEPPDTARALVQTYVSWLRRTLADAGQPDLIGTRSPGYLLRTGGHEIDREVFLRQAATARGAAADGRYDEAATHFAAALEQWRGPALGGVDSALLAGEAAQLDELRLAVIEERCEVELHRRRHEPLVAELTALVERYPTREALRRQLMVALYRCGRQADALSVYRAGRAALVDELGIEPGPALRAVHEAILRGDEELLAPADREPGAVRARPVPAQLPGVPTDFTGRAGHIAALTDHLTGHGAGVPVVVLSGKGGTGKTTLAARVAHQLVGQYPDGQIFAQLHGMSPTPSRPEDVLGRFLVALGDPPPGPEAGLDERIERYRSLLAGRRVLVVLDDAASEQQVRPLLPGQPGCAALITSRTRLAGLAGARLRELDTLDPDEAEVLLSRLVGPDRVAAEPAAAKRLAEQCGGLPLALRIVAARLAIRRHWSLEHLSSRLDDERRRLDELAVGDQEVRASIALSYHALDAQARMALRRLGALGLPDFTVWVLAALLDVDEHEAERVVERLIDSQFLDYLRTDRVGQDRYQLHDLLRLYASERADAEAAPADLDAAVRRVMRGWLHLIGQIMASHPTGGMTLRPAIPVTAGTVPAGAPPATLAAALADPRSWFEAEQQALVASVERAAARDLADVAAELASALCGSLFITDNLFDAWRRTHEAALAAVRRTGDRPAEAALLAEVGQLRYEQDRYAEARTYLLEALAAFRECQDPRGEAATLAALGTACREQGYLPEALHFLNEAEVVFRALDDEPASAYVWRLRGSVHLELGDYEATRSDLEAALAAFRRTGSRRGEAMTLRTTGLLHRALGEYERSYALCAQARAVFADLGDELMTAYADRSMAKALTRLGRCADADEPLQRALATCRNLGDRWGEAITLRTLGELRLAEGRLAEADTALAAALRLWLVLDLPLGRARTLRDLARLARARGDEAAARSHYAEAAEIFRLYGTREVAELAAEAA